MPPTTPNSVPEEPLVAVTIGGKPQLVKLSELPATDLDKLLGAGADLFESDEELDAFLADIRKRRGNSD